MTYHKLTAIANKHECDKGTVSFERHGYTTVYGYDIPDDRPSRLLEIGIGDGRSLRMWNEYNPKLKILAVDINPECGSVTLAVADIVTGDQGDRELWKEIMPGLSPFDFIIDDGSHEMGDQQISLSQLFPYLKSGGIYYIEDLHTCRWFSASSRTDDKLRAWAKTGRFSSSMLSVSENREISTEMLSVEFLCQGKLAKIIKR